MERLLIENLATILSITVLLGAVALGPIGRAIARRIEGSSGRDSGDFEQRIMDLERASHRVVELEDRLDFAERLLARREERLSLDSTDG